MRQLIGCAGSVVTGACCLGFTPLLTALTAIGADFLIKDVILIPLLVIFLGLAIWNLESSRKQHSSNGPLYLGSAAAILAFTSIWFSTVISYLGFLSLIAASMWDFILVRKLKICATS
jgi:mercuric ion transport protein